MWGKYWHISLFAFGCDLLVPGGRISRRLVLWMLMGTAEPWF